MATFEVNVCYRLEAVDSREALALVDLTLAKGGVVDNAIGVVEITKVGE